jgi:hypothetical protein
MAMWPDGQNTLEERERMSNYTEASRLYRSLGWQVVVPSKLPPDSKQPASAVHNVFGRGNTATAEQMDVWERDFPYRNCLLKMNRGIIGIDIDHYLKWSQTRNTWVRKRGFDHICEAISRHGDLPPTYSSTSRGKGQPSRILFFTVDEGVELSPAPFEDVEIIQLHHRYAAVWPSIHPETGEQYKWYGPDGEECAPPRPSDISPLPREWYPVLMTSSRIFKVSKRLTAAVSSHRPYPGGAEDWIDSLNDDSMSIAMMMLLSDFRDRPNKHVGHDELLSWLGRLNHLWAARGETGAREVFNEIAQAYWDTTNDSNPTVELSNAIRYVAGEDFRPCPQN